MAKVHEHSRPVTRREFVARGLMGSVTYLMAPSVLYGLTKQAWAATCGDEVLGDAADGFMPFMVFDLVGGAALPANFLVGGKGGSNALLKSYDTLGWDPRRTKLDDRFGIPMAGDGVSKILEGMLSRIPADAQKNLRMGSFCHIAQDDSPRNTTSALIEVSKSGLLGTAIKKGMGARQEFPGAFNTVFPSMLPSFKPMEIKRIEDATSIGGLAPIDFNLTKATGEKLLKAQADLTSQQAERFAGFDGGQELTELAECGHLKNIESLKNPTDFDPRKDKVFQDAYGLTTSSLSSTFESKSATVVRSVLNRFSGPGCLALENYDYHDGTSTTGDQKDREAGVNIGNAIRAAHLMKVPFAFQLLTDGGTRVMKLGSRIWTSDGGEKCMTIFGFYNPNGPSKMVRTQVGHYTEGQAAATESLVGGSPPGSTTRVAFAVLANYLNVCGKYDLIKKLVPNDVIPGDKIDEVLLFEKNA